MVLGAWSLGFCLLLVGMGMWLLVRGHVAGHEALGIFFVIVGIAGPGRLGARRLRLWLRPEEGRAGRKRGRVELLTATLLTIVFGFGVLSVAVWLFLDGKALSGVVMVGVGTVGTGLLGAMIRRSVRERDTDSPQE